MERTQGFDIQGEEQAIRQMLDDWLKASERGDLTTILTLMADDVVFMVPDREPFGKQEFAENYKQMAGTRLSAESDIQEIKILGEWAWLHNFLRVTFTPREGTATIRSGHVLTILRKNGVGKWVIARDANLLMPQQQ
jgi:uncharacterized protein (TIGR02246 family)